MNHSRGGSLAHSKTGKEFIPKQEKSLFQGLSIPFFAIFLFCFCHYLNHPSLYFVNFFS